MDDDIFRKNYNHQLEKYYVNLENRAGKYNNSSKVKNVLSLGYDIKWPERKSNKVSKIEKEEEFEREPEVNALENSDIMDVKDVIRSSIEKVKERNHKVDALPAINQTPKLNKNSKRKKIGT